MSLPTYQVFVRNGAYTRLERIDDWLSLSFVQRWNDVGTWQMELGTETLAASLLPLTGGIIITRDGTTVFSGRVTKRERSTRVTTFSGVDDNALMAGALALPNPEGPPYTNEFYLDEDVASTAMRALIQLNIGMTASRVDRRISALNLETSDPLLGGVVIVRARFVSLLALLQEIAVAPNAGGLRFWIAQSDDDPDQIQFRVRESVDRRATVVFSRAIETISDYADVYDSPEATYLFLAGGDTMDPDRTIIEGGSSAAELEAGRRIEVWSDARDNDDLDEMAQEHASGLAAMSSTRKITVDVVESESFVWGTHWELGDTVTVIDADGAEYVDVIRELEASFDPKDGARVTPMVGAVGATNDTDSVDGRAARHIAAMDRRVSHLERSWSIPAAKISSIQNLPAGTVTNAMLDSPLQWAAGDIKPTARSAAQTGWLLCQGQAISRTTYAALFTAISTTFGVGDGSTTFNIPDLQGRFPMGASGGHARGASGGAETVNLQHSHGMAHSHAHDHGGNTGNSTNTNNDMAAGGNPRNSTNHEHPITSDSTGSSESNTGNAGSTTQSVLNPYLAINWEIYAGV